MAMRSRCWSPCVSCKAYGKRCSQSRPCTRCVKSGRQCTRLDIALSESDPRQTAAIVAERPMRFFPMFMIGDETLPVIQLPSELHWVSVDLMKNMAVGHDVEALTWFFTTMNLSDSSALYHAVNHAASLGSSLGTPFSSAKPPTPQLRARSTSQDDYKDDMETDGADSQFWNMETGIASFRTTFDPVSRRRRAIIANARQTSFYGVHPEEFQVRRRASTPAHTPAARIRALTSARATLRLSMAPACSAGSDSGFITGASYHFTRSFCRTIDN